MSRGAERRSDAIRRAKPSSPLTMLASSRSRPRGIRADGRRCRRPHASRRSMTRCAPAATRSVTPPRPSTSTTARRRRRARTVPSDRQEPTRARPPRATSRPRSADRGDDRRKLPDGALPSPRSVSIRAARARRRHPGQVRSKAFEPSNELRGRRRHARPQHRDPVARPRPRSPPTQGSLCLRATPAARPPDLRTIGTSLSARRPATASAPCWEPRTADGAGLVVVMALHLLGGRR